jgi:hypothetical protein
MADFGYYPHDFSERGCIRALGGNLQDYPVKDYPVKKVSPWSCITCITARTIR